MKKKAMFIAVSLVVSAPIVVGAYFLALRRYALEKPIAASQESGFLARQTSNSTAESAYKAPAATTTLPRSEEHTSELQSRLHLVCRLLLEKKKKIHRNLAFTDTNIRDWKICKHNTPSMT